MNEDRKVELGADPGYPREVPEVRLSVSGSVQKPGAVVRLEWIRDGKLDSRSLPEDEVVWPDPIEVSSGADLVIDVLSPHRPSTLLVNIYEGPLSGVPTTDPLHVIECRGQDWSVCSDAGDRHRIAFKAAIAPGDYRVSLFASWVATFGSARRAATDSTTMDLNDLPPEVFAAWTFSYRV